jgi:predicted phosphodiesterase
MRIGVLADIHGNLPALRAVLVELDREPADAIVVAGDAVAGPLVCECLELLRDRPEPVHWISGNSERETVNAYDGTPQADDPDSPAARAARWSAQGLDRDWRDRLASWPIAVELDGTDEHLKESLLEQADPDWVADFLERCAGRS